MKFENNSERCISQVRTHALQDYENIQIKISETCMAKDRTHALMDQERSSETLRFTK